MHPLWEYAEKYGCAVCHEMRFDGTPVIAGLVLDHDHKTGLVRGLLCQSCNITEPGHDGVFEEYRANPPAKQLGVVEKYVHWSGYECTGKDCLSC